MVTAEQPGWSFEQRLADFRKLEDDPDGDIWYHSRGGPVPIRRVADRLTALLTRRAG